MFPKTVTLKVPVDNIEITPELQEHFDLFGKKVRATASIAEIKEMFGPTLTKKLKDFKDDNQRVLITCDYEHGILDIEEITK